LFVEASRAADLKAHLLRQIGGFADRPACSRGAVQAIPYIRGAVEQGAHIVTGEILPDREGITPTVLADVPPRAAILKADLFAPVLSLLPVRDMGEALRLDADCPYALSASIFGDEREAAELADRVRAGSVVINDIIVPTADPRLPFGGRGRSGFGVTRGAEGLLELTTIKVICTRRGGHRHLDETTADDVQLLKEYMQATHGRTIRDRLAAAWRMAKNVLSRERRR
jgi:acyl-CoA reductase-like NAD-dependent aldehyde dehydrogenase